MLDLPSFRAALRAIPLLLLALPGCEEEGCSDERAVAEDGRCVIKGCTDATAINYDETATSDDGTCMTFSNFTTTFERISSSYGLNYLSPNFDEHFLNDDSAVRNVYALDDLYLSNGSFPVGTVIAIHSYSQARDTNEYMGMVKQSPGFNSSERDWEWFVLNSDGTVALDTAGNELRGAMMMNQSCSWCHDWADTEYVFNW